MPFCGILDYNKGKVEKMLKKYISIDIGGTAIKYGIIDENGTILSRYEMKTEASKGGAAILQKTVNIVKELTAKLQKSAEFEMTGEDNNKPAGICISTAGMVDIEKGEIFYSAPLIPEYAGTNFKKTMEELGIEMARSEVADDWNGHWRKCCHQWRSVPRIFRKCV